MKIGIIIGRIGGVDGVALETEKWIHILHKMGHKVFILSGEYEDRKIEAEKETVLPILSFFAPETRWEQKHAFFHPEEEPEAVVEHIDTAAEFIAKKIERWIRKRELDIVISENASALPSHLSMGVGIKRAVERTGINTITHDHDFSWERDSRYVSPFKQINRLIDVTFPLRLPNSKHAVINTYGQETLKKKYGRDSAMVPNVMDFDKPFGILKNQNKKLRKDLGLKKKDILLFQITRIVRRKGIEVAIELINKLEDKNIKLVRVDVTWRHVLMDAHRESCGPCRVAYASAGFDAQRRRVLGIQDHIGIGDELPNGRGFAGQFIRTEYFEHRHWLEVLLL